MNQALNRAQELYEIYKERSKGKVPEKFNKKDKIIIQIIEEENFFFDWLVSAKGLAILLNDYQRVLNNPEILEGEYATDSLFTDFCQLCARGGETAKRYGAAQRYATLESLGVTPEFITYELGHDKFVANAHADVISAYAIPFFERDAAFIDFMTNPDSPYRKGNAFHKIVEEERRKDRERRRQESKKKKKKAAVSK